ncbi:MAG: aminodeoxychorismate lyase [Pseudomonadales bacterium]
MSVVTKTLINGRYACSISCDDRGLAYGDGLFETIKVSAGNVEYLREHLQRLALGCKRLRINCDNQLLYQEINQLLLVNNVSQAVIKVMVTRGHCGRGYKPDFDVEANRIISLESLSVDYSRQQNLGVKVRLCDTRLSVNPSLAGLKHLSRIENVLARSEWDDADIAEGLLLDVDGRLVEGTMSNLFLVKDGTLLTPSLHRCGVEGVIRKVILGRVLPALQLPFAVTDLVVEDIYHAQELFLCNSLMGVWPVIAVGCHKKSVGSVTLTIQRALTADLHMKTAM